MTPLTILIPVYNQARYLPLCLHSILKQEFQRFEIIAIDDGSTDASRSILDAYAAADSRIKVISKSNGGYGSALNVGLAAAAGDYIGIVEPDDTIEPQMYRRLMAAAEQTQADIVKCSFRRIIAEGLEIEEKGWYPASGKIFCLCEHPELCRLHPAIWAAVYKRQLLEDNHIRFSETPGATYQDVPFFADTFSAAKRIFIVPQALYNYRIESENAFSSSNAVDAKVFYRLENHRQAQAIYKARRLWEAVKYNELQREFITLNNFALRIKGSLRRTLFEKIQDYFAEFSAGEAAEFLPSGFQTSFRLIKKGSYNRWFLQYALLRITIIRMAQRLGLTNRLRHRYYKWKDSRKAAYVQDSKCCCQ